MGLHHGERGQDKGFDHLFQPRRLAFSPCGLKQLRALCFDRVAVAPLDLKQEPLFAAEIVAEQGPVDAGGRGDGPHADALIPVQGKEAFGGGDQDRRIERAARCDR